jgi:hypothetical protein
MFRWIRYDIGSVSFGFKRLMFEGFKVELCWWQIPPAMAIAATYYTFLLAGSLLSVIAPRMMRDRFKL